MKEHKMKGIKFLLVISLLFFNSSNYYSQTNNEYKVVEYDTSYCVVNSFSLSDKDSISVYYEILNFFYKNSRTLYSSSVKLNGTLDGFYIEYFRNGKMKKSFLSNSKANSSQFNEWFSKPLSQTNNKFEIFNYDTSYCIVNSFVVNEMDSISDYYEFVNYYNITDSTLIYSYTTFNGVQEGYCFEYYKNGQLKKCSQNMAGVKANHFIEWYYNGIIKTSGTYKYMSYSQDNDVKSDSIEYVSPAGNGFLITTEILPRKIGRWKYFDINGVLLKQEYWEE